MRVEMSYITKAEEEAAKAAGRDPKKQSYTTPELDLCSSTSEFAERYGEAITMSLIHDACKKAIYNFARPQLVAGASTAAVDEAVSKWVPGQITDKTRSKAAGLTRQVDKLPDADREALIAAMRERGWL